MNKTRKLFVLKGNSSDLQEKVKKEICFKGLTVIDGIPSMQEVEQVFANNKSIVCYGTPEGCTYPLIEIMCGEESLGDFNYINLKENIAQQFERIAQIHRIDIGDHKSNSSGINGAPSIEDCAYCKMINGVKDELFEQYGGKINRIIYQSENFLIMPTLGQFVKGYMLIIPIEHITSIADLKEELIDEYLMVLNDCLYILNLTYGDENYLVWENGTGNGGIGKARDSVVHAHVHVVHSHVNIKYIKQISGISFDRISIRELKRYGENSYLLITESEEECYINDDPDVYIPRQYVRQIIAEENSIQGELWNWRKYGFAEQVLETDQDVKKALIANWNNLPKRVQENTKDFLF